MAAGYSLKESPYGSHALILGALPARGEGRRVLDLGCASGYLASILAGRGFAVTGVERAGVNTAGAARDFELVEADLDSGLPPLDGRFDYVVCADILEHLKDPGAFLAEVGGVLAPGGRLIASLPNSGNLYFRLNILCGRFPRHDRGLFDRTHLHFLMWRNWVELFAGAGFAIEGVRSAGVPVGLAVPRLADTFPVRAAERLSYDLARIWKTLFAYQFIVTARPEGGRG